MRRILTIPRYTSSTLLATGRFDLLQVVAKRPTVSRMCHNVMRNRSYSRKIRIFVHFPTQLIYSKN